MYSHTWKKYLPVIKILLKRSAAAEQVFNVDRIDFEKITRSNKSLYSFSIELMKGRLIPSSAPLPGKDLFEVLMEDPVTKDMIRQNHYMINMNNKFQLHIKNTSAVGEAATSVQNAGESGEMEPEQVADEKINSEDAATESS